MPAGLENVDLEVTGAGDPITVCSEFKVPAPENNARKFGPALVQRGLIISGRY